MPNLAVTHNQLQIQSKYILLDNIQDLTMPEHDGNPKAPNTRDEDRSAIQQSDSQRDNEPLQGVTTEMITELSKVTTSDVLGKIFYLQAMLPNYAGKEKPYPLIIYIMTSDPDTMYMYQAIKHWDY